MDFEPMTDEEKRINRLFVPWFRASMKLYPPKYGGLVRWMPNGKAWGRKRKRKKKSERLPDGTRRYTKKARNRMVAEHRAADAARGKRTKRELADVLASLSADERAAVAASPHVITAVEKIVEAMLFRFS